MKVRGQTYIYADADWNVLLMGPVANEIIEKRFSLWNEKRNGVEGRNWIKVVDSSKTHQVITYLINQTRRDEIDIILRESFFGLLLPIGPKGLAPKLSRKLNARLIYEITST